jgi:pimeloyl-ACP methyl ester carboxylesterase
MSGKGFVSTCLGLLLASFGILYFLRFHSGQPVFPVQGQYLKVDKYRLYLKIKGEGRPLLFLHGFPYNSETYNALIAQPMPGYRLIIPDFPGCGLSDKNLEQPLNPEDLAVVVKLLLDKLEIKNVDVIGHDLGGGVALVLAALFPNLVQQLVLIAPDSSDGAANQFLGWWWKTPLLGEVWATFFLNRDFIRYLLQESWTQDSDSWHELVERYYLPLETLNGRSAFLKLNRGRIAFDYLKFEEHIQNPCLLIWGGQDRIIPFASGQRLLQSLGNAKMEVMSKAGHLPQEQFPEEVGGLIKKYLLANTAVGIARPNRFATETLAIPGRQAPSASEESEISTNSQ